MQGMIKIMSTEESCTIYRLPPSAYAQAYSLLSVFNTDGPLHTADRSDVMSLPLNPYYSFRCALITSLAAHQRI